MIDINYFKSFKILDGGMGQQLLSKGLQTKGSLWSASALLEEKYHLETLSFWRYEIALMNSLIKTYYNYQNENI